MWGLGFRVRGLGLFRGFSSGFHGPLYVGANSYNEVLMIKKKQSLKMIGDHKGIKLSILQNPTS